MSKRVVSLLIVAVMIFGIPMNTFAMVEDVISEESKVEEKIKLTLEIPHKEFEFNQELSVDVKVELPTKEIKEDDKIEIIFRDKETNEIIYESSKNSDWNDIGERSVDYYGMTFTYAGALDWKEEVVNKSYIVELKFRDLVERKEIKIVEKKYFIDVDFDKDNYYVGEEEYATCKIKIKDKDSNPMAGKEAVIKMLRESLKVTLDENGEAEVTVKIKDAEIGIHGVWLELEGNKIYDIGRFKIKERCNIEFKIKEENLLEGDKLIGEVFVDGKAVDDEEKLKLEVYKVYRFDGPERIYKREEKLKEGKLNFETILIEEGDYLISVSYKGNDIKKEIKVKPKSGNYKKIEVSLDSNELNVGEELKYEVKLLDGEKVFKTNNEIKLKYSKGISENHYEVIKINRRVLKNGILELNEKFYETGKYILSIYYGNDYKLVEFEVVDKENKEIKIDLNKYKIKNTEALKGKITVSEYVYDSQINDISMSIKNLETNKIVEEIKAKLNENREYNLNKKMTSEMKEGKYLLEVKYKQIKNKVEFEIEKEEKLELKNKIEVKIDKKEIQANDKISYSIKIEASEKGKDFDFIVRVKDKETNEIIFEEKEEDDFYWKESKTRMEMYSNSPLSRMIGQDEDRFDKNYILECVFRDVTASDEFKVLSPEYYINLKMDERAFYKGQNEYVSGNIKVLNKNKKPASNETITLKIRDIMSSEFTDYKVKLNEKGEAKLNYKIDDFEYITYLINVVCGNNEWKEVSIFEVKRNTEVNVELEANKIKKGDTLKAKIEVLLDKKTPDVGYKESAYIAIRDKSKGKIVYSGNTEINDGKAKFEKVMNETGKYELEVEYRKKEEKVNFEVISNNSNAGESGNSNSSSSETSSSSSRETSTSSQASKEKTEVEVIKGKDGRKIAKLKIQKDDMRSKLKDKSLKPIVIELDKKDAENAELELESSLVEEIKKSGKTLELSVGDTKVKVPVKAINSDKKNVRFKLNEETFSKEEVETLKETYQNKSKVLDFKVEDVDGKELELEESTEIVVPFDKKDTKNPEKLGMYYFDEESKEWKFVGGKIDAENGTITFKADKYAKFIAFENNVEFKDAKNHWAQNPIEVLAARHVVNGFEDGSFDPEATVTKAQFVKMVNQVIGLEKSSYMGGFVDVYANDWYAEYLQSAAENNIIDEVTNFNPNEAISRVEMAYIVANALKTYDANLTQKADFEFEDTNNVSDNYKDAIKVAYKYEIVNGMDEKTFAPNNSAKRAETVKMLYKMLKVMGEI